MNMCVCMLVTEWASDPIWAITQAKVTSDLTFIPWNTANLSCWQPHSPTIKPKSLLQWLRVRLVFMIVPVHPLYGQKPVIISKSFGIIHSCHTAGCGQKNVPCIFIFQPQCTATYSRINHLTPKPLSLKSPVSIWRALTTGGCRRE